MKADLLMAIHFHQPVGNFDHVIEKACDKCYIPFMGVLKQYPDIRMSFHFTGCLLEWIEKKRPEMLGTIRGMVKSGQVEMMSGGFYEPILVSIPERDRISQIKMLSGFVKEEFGYEPKGAWVAERVWEPNLAAVFSDAGIKYIILDDTHFFYAGVKNDDKHGYYITEDNGKKVAVFPSDKTLRYHIPFRLPWECVSYMKSVAERMHDPVFIYGDDGEKFGEWPGTNKWVYEDGWLKNFFDELMRNNKWITTKKFADCLAERDPLGRVYLPTASYGEMLKWALPADNQEWFEDVLDDVKRCGKEEFYGPFLRGGFWRSFLARYPESNQMNKKMLYVSDKVQVLRQKIADKGAMADIEKELFRGQCNCPYWHGVFGGLYLFHLRKAIYESLIKAEVGIDKALYGGKPFLDARVLDMDADGSDEAVVENRELALCFAPAKGGTLREIDSKTAYHNVTNVLSRRKEAYHRRILQKIREMEGHAGYGSGKIESIHDVIQLKDAAIKDHLSYDWYDRCGLIDHFIRSEVDIRSFSSCTFHESGDFVKGRYSLDLGRSKEDIVITMARKGAVDSVPVSVTKKITLPKEGSFLTVDYTVKNESTTSLNVMFGPEFNITMPDAASDRYWLEVDTSEERKGLNDSIERIGVKVIKIEDRDKRFSCRFELSEECRLWHFPVKTVSQSETAYELNYQSSAIFPAWKLDLKGGERKNIRIRLDIRAIRP